MFINKKVCKEVADELIKMVEDLILNIDDFDERAAELLATFTPEQGRFIVKELHVYVLFGYFC
jgi:hypothetical protein